jgi:hypothetical protein
MLTYARTSQEARQGAPDVPGMLYDAIKPAVHGAAVLRTAATASL